MKRLRTGLDNPSGSSLPDIPPVKKKKPNPPPVENITPDFAAGRLPGAKGKEVARGRSLSPDIPPATGGSESKRPELELTHAESSKSKEPNFEPTQEDYGLLADITEYEINSAILKLTDPTEKTQQQQIVHTG